MIYSPNDVVGPYRVVGLIGQGGMGQVYLADDTRLLRRVALKVLDATIPGASLLREARMAARLHHPNVATVHDLVEANGRLHIAMEYLDGQTLSRRLQTSPMAALEAATCLSQVLRGVGHAHDLGVIHCDLKPANIFILPGGDVKVLDFGLARLETGSTHSQPSMALAGTPGYVAPERLRGAPPSQLADIYSLGIVLQEMLQPRTPLPAPTPATSSKLIGRLSAVAATAAAADPGHRFPSVTRMREEVDQAVSELHTSAVRWQPRGAGMVIGVACALLTAMLVWWSAQAPAPEPAPAVVSVRLGALGPDPMAGYIAAALEQVLRGSFSRADINVVAVRADVRAAQDEGVGATHIVSGTVSRSGDTIELDLSVTDRRDAAISSRRVVGGLDDLPGLGAAVVAGVGAVLRSAGVAGELAAVDAARVRSVLAVSPQAFENYAQARDYLRTPDVRDAIDHAIGLLQKAIDTDRGFALAYASLAEAYWQKYDLTRDDRWTDRAMAAGLDAIRLDPDDAAVRYTLALIYRGKGRNAEALDEVSRSIERQPRSDDGYRLRGQLQAELGRLDAALDDLSIARRLRPGFWDNHRTTGLVLYRAGRFAAAIPYFLRVTELRPANASAHQMLGTAYHAAGNVAEALREYEAALAIEPNANTHSNIAKIHYDAGRFDLALRAYEQSAQIQPKEPITHRNLGDTLTRLGQGARARSAYAKAISLAAEALSVNPSRLDAIGLQALCYAKLGNRADAVGRANLVLASDRASPSERYRAAVALVIVDDPRGIDAVAGALSAGFSRSVAALDEDLAAVRHDPRLALALKPPG